MRPNVAICVAVTSVILTGCNQPAVSLKPPAFQSSENTVRDWNDVAHWIAAGMTSRGLLPGQSQSVTVVETQTKELPLGLVSDSVRQVTETGPRPVFIRLQAPDSAFVRQVGNELEAEILRRGGSIARRPDGATVVNLDVDVVRWGPRDKPPGLVGTTMAVSAIPGIIIGASAPMSLWTAADAASSTTGGFGIFADLIAAMTPTMNAEAVWEATIVTDDRLVMKLQEPIYIRAPDIPLYAKATNLSPVASWKYSAPLVARQIRYAP